MKQLMRPALTPFTRDWQAKVERDTEQPGPWRVWLRDENNDPVNPIDVARAFGPNDAANQALHEATVRYGNHGWWVLGSKPLDPDLPLPGEGDELAKRYRAGDR